MFEGIPQSENTIDTSIMGQVLQAELISDVTKIVTENGENDPNRKSEIRILELAENIAGHTESGPITHTQEIDDDSARLAYIASMFGVGIAGGLATTLAAVSEDYEAAKWIGGYTVGLLAALKAASIVSGKIKNG